MPQKTILYFAYGSNLDARQMRTRCPGSRFAARASLPNHALTFGGFSGRWGGGVATVYRLRGNTVPGVVYELDPDDLRSLDGHEGHPFAYRRCVRTLLTDDGKRIRAHVYIQTRLEPFPPPRRYLEVMRHAYARFGFDRRSLDNAARVWS